MTSYLEDFNFLNFSNRVFTNDYLKLLYRLYRKGQNKKKTE